MINGKLCVSARGSRIMCRVDPKLVEELTAKEGCRPMEMNGTVYKGYVYVDRKVLRTREKLSYWVGLALDFNRQLTS